VIGGKAGIGVGSEARAKADPRGDNKKARVKDRVFYWVRKRRSFAGKVADAVGRWGGSGAGGDGGANWRVRDEITEGEEAGVFVEAEAGRVGGGGAETRRGGRGRGRETV